MRISSGWHQDERINNVAEQAGILVDPRSDAVKVIQRMGLSLDCWLYHNQLDEFAQLADAHPDLTIILNHVGSPILGGPYRGKTDEVFEHWKVGIAHASERQNVFVKLGAMPIRMPSYEGDRTLPPGSGKSLQRGVCGWKPALKPLVPNALACTSRTFRCKSAGAVIKCAGMRLNAFAGASAAEKTQLFAAARAYCTEGGIAPRCLRWIVLRCETKPAHALCAG